LPPPRAHCPPEKHRDYRQYTIGQDASYAWRSLAILEEIIASRFEVPNVGNADTLAYYLEAKYKNHHALLRRRAGPAIFGTVTTARAIKSRGQRRVATDAALGWRWNQHLADENPIQLQPSTGALQQGEQLVAAPNHGEVLSELKYRQTKSERLRSNR